MLNKYSQGLVMGIFMLVLSACGDTQQSQSYVDHLSRAQVYQEQGQYKAAVIEYKNAVRKSEGNADAFLQYAKMLNRLGQYDAALNMLEQATEGKNEAYYLELARTYQGMKKFFSAKELLDKQLNKSSLLVKQIAADNALGMGDLDAALKLYDALIADSYLKNEGLLGKATVLARTGQIEQSLTLLEQIDLSSATAVKANILKAGIEISQQQLTKAEATLSDVLASMRNTDIIEPDKVVVLERLSYVLTRQGRSNEAYIYTKILSDAFPGANEVRTEFQAAVEKMDAGEMEQAKVMLKKILEDYPNYKRASQLLGVISYIEGDIPSASKYLSESVDPEIANDMTRHIYAATNLKLNDPKRVLEILEPGIDRTNVPATLALYGLAAISDKQYDKGEAALLKALELDEKNVRVRLALANFYRNKPSPDLAKEKAQLLRAYELEPTDRTVVTDMLAFTLRNDGVAKANAFIEKALAKHPDDYSTNLLAGSFMASQQNFEKALAYFDSAINTKPSGQELLNVLFAKGRAQLTLKQSSAAEQTFAELIRLYPDNQLGYKGMLSVYMLKQDFDGGAAKLETYARELKQLAPYAVLIEAAVAQQDLTMAKSYFDKAGKLDVNEQELAQMGQAIRFVEAAMAMQANDFAEARSLVADLLSEEPENIRLLSFLVDVEIKAGQLNEASKILAQIENIDYGHPVVNVFKGDLAILNKDMKTARHHLSHAWKNFPSDPVAEKLYKVLATQGDQVETQKHLDDWLALLPGSPAARLYQALGFQQANQKNKAIEAYEKVLETLPNNVLALNNLGWLYFEVGDKRSLVLLKKAVELAPENAAVLDSYGWVLVKNGQKSEGIVYLEKAHKLAPDEAEIKAHLDQAKRM